MDKTNVPIVHNLVSEKHLSCWWLHNYGIFFPGHGVQVCCSPGRGILFPSASLRFPVEEYFAFRESIEEKLNADIECECSGCPALEKRVWGNRRYFPRICFSPSLACNLSCSFCSQKSSPLVSTLKSNYNDIIAVMKELMSQGVIDANTEISTLGGEPMILPGFDQFVDYCVATFATQLEIITNATIFSRSVARGMDMGKVWLHTSPDAGNRETFKKLKKKDLFDQVMENIHRYTKITPYGIKVKYILLPQNCDEANWVVFLETMKQFGVQKLDLSFEFMEKDPYPLLITETAGKFRYRAERMGFQLNVLYNGMDRFPAEGRDYRSEIENAYRAQFPDYATVQENARKDTGSGRILTITRANNRGLWLNGWAYDRENERKAEDVVIFWRDMPVFSGICRFIRQYIRRTIDTEFSFNMGDIKLADKILSAPHQVSAYAKFGSDWVKLDSITDAP